jgi:hypothetical protein
MHWSVRCAGFCSGDRPTTALPPPRARELVDIARSCAKAGPGKRPAATRPQRLLRRAGRSGPRRWRHPRRPHPLRAVPGHHAAFTDGRFVLVQAEDRHCGHAVIEQVLPNSSTVPTRTCPPAGSTLTTSGSADRDRAQPHPRRRQVPAQAIGRRGVSSRDRARNPTVDSVEPPAPPRHPEMTRALHDRYVA